jgi:ribosome-binding factor A
VSGANGARRQRVAQALREALTEAIAADVKDPRVHAPDLVTVTRVELNVDMAVANVYVSIVTSKGEAVVDAALAGLAKAAGFLRGPIARTVGLQRAPELRFFVDKSVDMSDKLAQILHDDEVRARAAGRVPGEAEPAPDPADDVPEKTP